MDIPFIKMNGLGNDFVIFDVRSVDMAGQRPFAVDNVPLTESFMQSVAHRRTGIGCDQIIILGDSLNADVFMDIYNQDGSTAGACGNATRCVAGLILQESDSAACKIETVTGILECFAHTDSSGDIHNTHITVNMGKPKFDWQDIPVSNLMDTTDLQFDMDDLPNGMAVNMGNPHCVFIIENADTMSDMDLQRLGQYVEHHCYFPDRTNVEFITVTDTNTIHMRVWERGGMITQACGSGACAVFAVAHHKGLTGAEAVVYLDGGALHMSKAENGGILMRGAYSQDFVGMYHYDG